MNLTLELDHKRRSFAWKRRDHGSRIEIAQYFYLFLFFLLASPVNKQ